MKKTWGWVLCLVAAWAIGAGTSAKGGTSREDTLLNLAREHFTNDIWIAEETMIRNVANAGFAMFGPADGISQGTNDFDTAHAESWPTNRFIRADRMAWLYTDPEATKLMGFRGIQIANARIIGKLDLAVLRSQFGLIAWQCAFTDQIDLEHAHLQLLYLYGSKIGELYGDGLEVERDVYLRDGFVATKQIRLPAAKIGGVLDLGGSTIPSIDAHWAHIEGSVLMYNGFEAESNINFSGAVIGHDFVFLASHAQTNVSLNLTAARTTTFRDNNYSMQFSPTNLNLDGFIYDRIDNRSPLDACSLIAWLHLQPTNTFFPQPYQQLAKVLISMGHQNEAADVMIAKNSDFGATLRWSTQWPECLWYKIFGRLIGYGYKTWEALFWSFGVILFGSFVFSTAYRNPKYLRWFYGSKRLITYTRGEHDISKKKDKLVKFNAFVYSLETFVPFLKLEMGSHWRPNGNRGRKLFKLRGKVWLTAGGALRGYYWIHIIIGWVLTTLLVGALTGLLKT
jgi:hypothetical protein